ACSSGGGDNSTTSSNSPSPVISQSQIISLTNPGPIEKVYGQPNFTNLAYGNIGTGEITYSSSDTSIATVDSNSGEVSIINTGTATITASKAADNQYAAADVSYILNISPDTQIISFADPGPISKSYGDANFSNIASGGPGSGNISYSSSNTSVAIVDANSGEVSIIIPGSTIITATKAADEHYRAASASYKVSIPKLVQSIAFADSGPIYKTPGSANFSNTASGGQGSGIIVYSSSAPYVARVNTTTGVVDILNNGLTIINAFKYGDVIHSPVQTSYTLIVAPDSASFRAWVGETDTQVDFDSSAEGLNFIRSTDKNCDLANYSLCANGQLDVLTNSTINDTAINANRSGWYWLQYDNTNSQAATLAAPNFTARTGLHVAEFRNKLWLIGGLDGSYKNDVWASDNGIAWTQTTADAAFSPRADHQLLSFNNKLWLIGGGDNSMKNDVWSSSDGSTWTQVNANAAFSARRSHQALVFNNKMWLIAGWDGSVKNDVWSSSNGINWTQETAAAAFSPRQDHQVVVFNNKMWLIGGRDSANKNDIWSSSDGINWTQESSAAAFSARYNHQVSIFNGKFWLIGGQDGSNKNDIWSSGNGIDWVQENSNADLPASTTPQLQVFDNKLLLIKADDDLSTHQVWSSTDGNNWRQGFHNTIYFP
ncbi:MAG TPA: hypothetical protein ENJ65_06895, partial [Candidatus Tenderia electrophaga]|nr:hypothetical protein [Candidatus Tenderia electrophaga]